jgi:DNA invertase Pin-like site-specific DNA recombinase
MAEQGRKADEATKRMIRRLAEQGRNKTEIARLAHVSRPTAYKYAQERIEELEKISR